MIFPKPELKPCELEEAASASSTCSIRSVAVPADSTLVARSMDCTRVPDSVKGVMLTTGSWGTGIETARLCETRRFAVLMLSPSTPHPTLPFSPTLNDEGIETGGDGEGFTFAVPFRKL